MKNMTRVVLMFVMLCMGVFAWDFHRTNKPYVDCIHELAVEYCADKGGVGGWDAWQTPGVRCTTICTYEYVKLGGAPCTYETKFFNLSEIDNCWKR